VGCEGMGMYANIVQVSAQILRMCVYSEICNQIEFVTISARAVG